MRKNNQTRDRRYGCPRLLALIMLLFLQTTLVADLLAQKGTTENVNQGTDNLGDLFRRLEKKYPAYRFLYDYDQLKNKKAPAGLVWEGVSLEQVLKTLNT